MNVVLVNHLSFQMFLQCFIVKVLWQKQSQRGRWVCVSQRWAVTHVSWDSSWPILHTDVHTLLWRFMHMRKIRSFCSCFCSTWRLHFYNLVSDHFQNIFFCMTPHYLPHTDLFPHSLLTVITKTCFRCLFTIYMGRAAFRNKWVNRFPRAQLAEMTPGRRTEKSFCFIPVVQSLHDS